LDDVAKYFPHLKKLQIPEDAYTVDEQVVSHIPSTVEELELPVLNQKPEELLKILATTCQRLPLLRTCTLMISKDFMTEAVLQCLSSKAFENHAKMETLILRFPCGLSHPPIPKKTLENLLGQQFEISLVTTRPDLNYVIHQYTITKEKIDPLF